jgi:hypothetical protein
MTEIVSRKNCFEQSRKDCFAQSNKKLFRAKPQRTQKQQDFQQYNLPYLKQILVPESVKK